MRLSGLILAVAVVAVAFNGCSKPNDASGTSSNGSGDAGSHAEHDHDDHEHGDHDHGSKDGQTAMEKMAEGLAKLSDADRASAEKQHICPVTDDMLERWASQSKSM